MGLVRVLARLVKLFFIFLILVGLGIFAQDRWCVHQANNLRSQMRNGMSWPEVSRLAGSNGNWHMMHFQNDSASCGAIYRTRPETGRHLLSLATDSGTRTIQDLGDPEILKMIKTCPGITFSFVPLFSFTKVDFRIYFDENEKIIRITETRAWD